MKAPSAEEVLALVNAATGPDGTLDPTMQHLLMQMQEQHALNQAQLRAQAQTQRTHSEVELNVSEQPTTVKSENGHGTTSTAIDLMPLSAAAVDIGPPPIPHWKGQPPKWKLPLDLLKQQLDLHRQQQL
ncbi:hypothetical protein GQ600_362 [Phytophthora cactorum]|nr:hypothetical protein GQ600_362 [Phytophthora cactorum]